MKELTLGHMDSKDIAEWFGISYDYYRKTKTKTKKLKELELYCDFTRESRGITITRIYVSVYPYIGVNIKRNKLLPQKQEEWKGQTINTNTNIADLIIIESDTRPTVPKLNKKDEVMTMEETIQRDIHSYAQIVGIASIEDYGKPEDGINGGGKKGWCEFIECRARKREYTSYNFIPLDKEDIDYLESCWDDRLRATKTRQTLKNVSQRIKEDDELSKDEVFGLMKEWENSTYGKYIYGPMRDYLSDKYGDGEWIYARATLRHNWEEEESAF